MKIFSKYKPVYIDVTLEEFINEHDDWNYLYEDTDEARFNEFISGGNFENDIIEELKANREEVINIFNKQRRELSNRYYNDAVNYYYNLVNAEDLYDYDIYVPDSEILEKAKREAITKLYNKYCK